MVLTGRWEITDRKLSGDSIRELERRRLGLVHAVEFGAFVARLPATIAEAAPRPDGVDLTDAAAFDLSKRWLRPRILELFHAHRSD